MKVNVKDHAPIRTHEGARASRITAVQQLRRSVMACMLWEGSFYELGADIAKRIEDGVAAVDPVTAGEIAVEARTAMKLRHVPLLIVRAMARLPRHKAHVAQTLHEVIQRPDEITEYLAIYWRNGREKLSAQSKKGLARAFTKFNEYSLAKYDGGNAKVKLRDALFLCHAKPRDDAQAALWKRLVDGTMATPDTWEVALSGGKGKRETFERLMIENQLGALAFIRNFRNMQAAGVEKATIKAYASTLDVSRVLPFRFIAAARAVPTWKDVCDELLLRCTSQAAKLPGKTVCVVDVSGSMYSGANVSARSDMTRVDAAGALAAIIRETCEDARIYATAGNDYTRVHATAECPPRHGLALVDTFTRKGYYKTLGGGGIFLKQCMDWIKARERSADRIIVLTDEQDCDVKANPSTADAFGRSNYLINVSVERNGIAYDKWTHINGWSEAIVDYIRAAESNRESD